MTIPDLDSITLKPGEVLLLRPRRAMSMEEAARLQDTVKAAGIRAVIIAHDIEMFVGVNIAMPTHEDAVAADLLERQQQEYKDAYDAGRIVEYRDPSIAGAPDDWCAAHRHSWPHTFDFDRYEYRHPKG